MNILRSYVIGAMICITCNIYATEITPSIALQIASNKFAELSKSTRSVNSVHLAYTSKSYDGTPNFYVFTKDSNEGFVVVSASADFPEILGYSANGKFDADSLSAGAEAFLNQLSNIAYIQRQTSAKVLTSVNGNNSKATRDGESTDAVPPLLGDTVKYVQGEPYNLMCPLIKGKRCEVGCTAQSMGTVMQYFKYPDKGVGSYEYIDSLGSKQVLKVDFSQSTYDWKNIKGDYSNEYTQAQANAISRLMFDCGVSLTSQYGVAATSSEPVRQAAALSKYFGYDKGAQYYNRDFFSQDEWEEMMKNELRHGRPILYNSWSIYTGHAFVVDGYDGNGYFHTIIGNNGGYLDGYWAINYLSFWPEEYNYSYGAYNLLQTMTIGVQPDGRSGALPESNNIVYTKLSTNNTEATLSDEICVVAHNIANLGYNEFNGKLALRLYNTDSNESYTIYTFALDKLGIDDDPLYNPNYDYHTENASFTFPSDIPVGTYYVKMTYMADNDVDWQVMRTPRNYKSYILLTFDGNKILIDTLASSRPKLKITEYSSPSNIEIGETKYYYQTTIKNEGGGLFAGNVYFNLLQKNDSINVYTEYLYLEPGESHSINFYANTIIAKGGEYDYQVWAEKDILSAEYDVLCSSKVNVSKTSTDGVPVVINITEDEKTYNLQGIRIEYPEGIYIKGRKLSLKEHN